MRSVAIALLALRGLRRSRARTNSDSRAAPSARCCGSFEDESLQFLYSSDLVPDSLLVGVEPRHARSSRHRARNSGRTRSRDSIREPGALHRRAPAAMAHRLRTLERARRRCERRAPRCRARASSCCRWGGSPGRMIPGTSRLMRWRPVKTTACAPPSKTTRAANCRCASTLPARSQIARSGCIASRSTPSSSRRAAMRSRPSRCRRAAPRRRGPRQPAGHRRRSRFARCDACPGWSRAACRRPAICAAEKPMKCWFCSMAFRCGRRIHLPGYQSPFSLLDEDLIDSIDVFTGGFPGPLRQSAGGSVRHRNRRSRPSAENRHGTQLSSTHTRATPANPTDGSEQLACGRALGNAAPGIAVSVGGCGPTRLQRFVADRDASSARGPACSAAICCGPRMNTRSMTTMNAPKSRAARVTAGCAPTTHLRTNLTGNLWFGHSSIVIDRVGDVDKPEFAISNVSDHRDAQPLGRARHHQLAMERTQPAEHGIRVDRGPRRLPLRQRGELSRTHWRSSSTASRVSRARWRCRPTSGAPPCSSRNAGNSASAGCPESACVCRTSDVGTMRERTWDPRIGIRWEIAPAHRAARALGPIPPGR